MRHLMAWVVVLQLGLHKTIIRPLSSWAMSVESSFNGNIVGPRHEAILIILISTSRWAKFVDHRMVQGSTAQLRLKLHENAWFGYNCILIIKRLTIFAFSANCNFVTARCTLVQSAVLRSHVVCLSVRLSVCLSVCNVGGLWSHRLEFFENNFTTS